MVGISIQGGYVQGAGYGGGVLVDGASLRLEDSVVRGNAATDGGGIAVLADKAPATLQLLGVEVSTNTADVQGGGIGVFANGTARSASVTLRESTIHDNQAQAGGGLSNVASAGGKSSLEHFHQALAELQRGERKTVRVSVYGASHTQADVYPGYLRTYLQSRFGDVIDRVLH